MNIQVYIFIAILILLSPETVSATVQTALAEMVIKSVNNNVEVQNLDQETDRFLKAKSYVFKRDWSQARNRLEAYLKSYPAGSYRDEALYWLAQSTNKLANRSSAVNNVISLKEQAAQYLDDLLASYPQSLWKDDAQTLLVTLAGQLYLLSGEKRAGVDESALWAPMQEDEMEVFTWDLLQGLEDEVAVAVLERILETHEDPLVRKNVVAYLSLHYSDRAELILDEVARNDPDKSVREEAARIIDRINMDKIPVNLNYYCFSAVLKDKDELRRLQEGQLKVFSLPHGNSRSRKKAESSIEEFFNKKLKDVTFVSSSFGAVNSRLNLQFSTLLAKTANINLYVDKYIQLSNEKIIRPKVEEAVKNAIKTYTRFMVNSQIAGISHTIHDFQISALGDDFKKEYDQISGTVCIYDKEEDKEYVESYVVDETSDKLLAIRKGADVALMLLQFESEEEEEEGEIIYHTKFNDVNGCTIHSSRSSWNAMEMAGVGGVTDFGEAKAEIPSNSGTWQLVGNIISDSKKKRLIGRNAVLYNPSKKLVAEAAQIIVPVEQPEKYQLIGEK